MAEFAWYAPLAAIACLAIAYINHNWGYAADDSYITFRYADNLRAGYGLQFNVGERFYGTTAAGYAIILWLLSYPIDAALAILGHARSIGAGAAAIPIAATIVSSISISVICILALRLARRFAPNPIGLALAALATLFAFVGVAGNRAAAHETYPFLALALAGTYAYVIAARPASSALLLAGATCLRPDAGLIAVLTFAAGIVDAALDYARFGPPWKVRRPLWFAGLLGCLLVGWLAFVSAALGSVLPETLVAKQAQMTLGVFIGFDVAHLVERLVSFNVASVLVLAGVAVTVLLLSGLRPARQLPRELLLLSGVWLGFALGDTATYLLLGVSLWDWYAIAILFALAFAAFAASVCAAAIAWPTSPRWRAAALAAVLLLAGAIATTGGRGAAAHRLAQWLDGRNINGHLTSYQKAIEFIERDAPAGASVAISEPGAFGFKLGPRYRIVDELGLVSPGVARAILRGDMDYPFRLWKPDYIVLSWHGPYSPEGRPWLASDYDEVLAFTDPYFQMNHLDRLYVYRRKADRPPAAGSG